MNTFKSQISDFRLRNADCRTSLRTPHSALRNPRSPLNPEPRTLNPPSRPRPAVTIIEVLFAILITTVGLFSALAIFPFASAQARRARLNDMFAVAGRSAFHAFDVRGMRRPDRWLAWDESLPPSGPGVPPGGFVPVTPGSTSPSDLQAAESFCIDPRMIGKYLTYVPTPAGFKQVLGAFPYSDAAGNQLQARGDLSLPFFPYIEPYDFNGNGQVDPPRLPLLNRPGNAVGGRYDTSLMRRITLRSYSNSNLAMTLAQADTIFVSGDDISYDRPEDDKSKPAQQNAVLHLAPNQPEDQNAWNKRAADGKISWLATVVPQFDISGAPSDNYTLSIVMIHERTDPAVDKMRERLVNGALLNGTGASGGEILLASSDADQLKLKPNDWVMLSGTLYPSGFPGQPTQQLAQFQWYRVSDCDPEPELDTTTGQPTSGLYLLNATLIGRDWNLNYVAYPPPGAGSVPGAVRVTIVEGAHAVYEKSIRLEYGSSF